MELMRGVVDPELGSNLVELGMARGAQVSEDGVVRIEIALTTSGCPLRGPDPEGREGQARVASRRDQSTHRVGRTDRRREGRCHVEGPLPTCRSGLPTRPSPPTTKVLMVASGKGGVGKSTVTTNLAAALAAEGFNVGVMDADIWGYSVPRMLGVDGDLRSLDGKIVPLTRAIGEGRLDVGVDGLPGRPGGLGADVAGADAQPGRAALLRGRELGRGPRLPADRHAARHRPTCRWAWPRCCRGPR